MRSTKYYFIVVFLLLLSCGRNGEIKVVPNLEVTKEQLILVPDEGKWYFDKKPFSGFAVLYHNNEVLAERVGYCDGKKEGIAQKWYPDGLLHKQSFYISNRLDGRVQVWSPNPNSILIAESHYLYGVRHGAQTRWYPSGQLLKRTNIKMGKEEGMQQAWLENGKIYVNYEAKNGRTFGLKKANLCYELEDEVIQF